MAGAAHGAEVEDDSPWFLGEEVGRVRMGGAEGVEGHWKVADPDVSPLPSGRGRGDSCFYQRSIEEGDGAFGRNPREIQRSQSWDDRWSGNEGCGQREEGARGRAGGGVTAEGPGTGQPWPEPSGSCLSFSFWLFWGSPVPSARLRAEEVVCRLRPASFFHRGERRFEKSARRDGGRRVSSVEATEVGFPGGGRGRDQRKLS